MDYVIQSIRGVESIIITDVVDDQPHNRLIPVEAIASWMELLGLSDPAEALEAILHVQNNGEPECDYETGENAWTAPYIGLSELLETGESPLIDEAQKQAREKLGLPEVAAPIATFAMRRMARVFSAKELLHQELRGRSDTIDRMRGNFVATLIPEKPSMNAKENRG